MKKYYLLTIIIAMLFYLSYAQLTSFSLGTDNYTLHQGYWYSTDKNGKILDKIIPNRLIVRKPSRDTVLPDDFKSLGLEGFVNIDPYALIGNYYVISLDYSVEPISTAKRIFNSGIFDYIEFDAIGQWLDTPNDTMRWTPWTGHIF